MVSSASATACRRVRRRCGEHPGRDVVGEQPARCASARSDPPVGRRYPAVTSCCDFGGRRGRRYAHRDACAARARTPRRVGSRRSSTSRPASGDAPRRDPFDVALGRAHVPPTRCRRCGRAPRIRSRGTRPASSSTRCAGTRSPGRAQFEISYQCKPAAESTSSAIRYFSAWSSSSGAGAVTGGDVPAERRTRFDGERVRADVVEAEVERAGRACGASRRSISPGVP